MEYLQILALAKARQRETCDLVEVATLVEEIVTSGNEEACEYAIDCLVQAAADKNDSDHTDLLKLLIVRGTVNSSWLVVYHWFRVAIAFVEPRDSGRVRDAAAAIVWLISNDPTTANLAYPYAVDFEEADHHMIALAWIESIRRTEEYRIKSLKNAAEFFRDVNPEVTVECEDQVKQSEMLLQSLQKWDSEGRSSLIDLDPSAET